MTAAATEHCGALDRAVNALIAAFADCGGGWVDSKPLRAALAAEGIKDCHVRSARLVLGVRVMREGVRAGHRSLWLLPGDSRRVTRTPDGREVITYLGLGEPGDEMARRHREQVRRAMHFARRIPATWTRDA